MKSLKRISFLVLTSWLPIVSACSSHSVTLVHPHTGATVECSGSGFGLGAGWVESYINDCTRRNEDRGYVRADQLTPEQRSELRKRGLLP